MTIEVIGPLLLAAVLAVYFGIAVRTWLRFRGRHVVICPETGQPAGVEVDTGHAATTAVWEKADVRLSGCSRWPERKDCDQPCCAQIEAAPSETRTKTMATRFFAGKLCAICAAKVEPPNAATLQPGFIHPHSHEVQAWDEIAPANLPEAIEFWRPLCANCTLAESFRQRFHDRVTDRMPRPGTTPPRRSSVDASARGGPMKIPNGKGPQSKDF